jgi:hypothetical protein
MEEKAMTHVKNYIEKNKNGKYVFLGHVSDNYPLDENEKFEDAEVTKNKWIVSVPGKNLINGGIYFKTDTDSLSIMTPRQSMLGTFGISDSQYEFTEEELKKYKLTNCPRHIVNK